MDLFGSEDSQHSNEGNSNASSVGSEREAERSDHSGSEKGSDAESNKGSVSGGSRAGSRSPTPPIASGSDLDDGDVHDRPESERGHSPSSDKSGAAEQSGSDNESSDGDAKSERSAASGSPQSQASSSGVPNKTNEGNDSDDASHQSDSDAGPEDKKASDDEQPRSVGHASNSDADENKSDQEDEKSDHEDENKSDHEDENKSDHEDENKSDHEDGNKSEHEEDRNKSDHEEDREEGKAELEPGSEKEDRSDAEHKSGSDEENAVSRSPKRSKALASSDDDEDASPQKKPRLLSDSERSSGDEKNNATAVDLFGEDLADVSSDDEAHAKAPEGTENGEAVPMTETFGDEDRDEEHLPDEPVPETRIEVEIPRIATNLGKEIHFVKLPNFLSVDTRPYDPQMYEDEIDEDEVLDEEGRARLKLKVENTIRWRHGCDEDGNPKKESNARMVRWSDGSLSLHLGSEIFDVHKQSLMAGDHNHLFIRQGTGLQGQAVFKTKLSFRPHSTDSFTHRKMTLSLADRSQKTQKIRVLPNVGKDPEAHRSEMIKKEEDKLKASIRRENKQRRIREKSHGRGLSSSYLEGDGDEDDDGAISLSAIKNKYKKGGAALRERPSIYSSDEESGSEERERRLEQAKEDEDSDLDYFDRKKLAADGKKKTTAMLEDSDEED